MAEFPALPLWTDALIGDTYHLTPAEFGAYLRLLIAAWRSPDCSLPNDDGKLGRIAGDAKNWARLKGTVLGFFTIREDGTLIQKRLLREREYVSRKSQNQSSRAKSRWLKEKETADAGDASRQCHGNAPTPTPIEEKKKTTSSSKRRRGSRLPAEWVLPKAWGEWAVAEGMAEARVRHEADQFRDYWLGLGGQKACKVDWQATWRKWCRTAMEREAASRRPSRASNAVPQYGEQRTTKDGRTIMWAGAIDQWVEVRQ